MGEQVSQEISDGIRRSLDLRFILDKYVLKTDEYGTWFPAEYYPYDQMGEDRFWVLHDYDLRGFHFDPESTKGTASLDKMCLDYGVFPIDTDLSGVSLEMTSLDGTVFYKCNLVETCFAGAGGIETRFEECDMRRALLWEAGFARPDVRGSDLRGAYLEGCHLDSPVLDFRTRFDPRIVRNWKERHIGELEAARIYRELADGCRSRRFFGKADDYYVAERQAARELIRIERREANNINDRVRGTASLAIDYLSDLAFGYGVRPARIASCCLVSILFFAVVIWLFDLLKPSGGFGPSLYPSVLPFTTFGLGEASNPHGAGGRIAIGAEAVL